MLSHSPPSSPEADVDLKRIAMTWLSFKQICTALIVKMLLYFSQDITLGTLHLRTSQFVRCFSFVSHRLMRRCKAVNIGSERYASQLIISLSCCSWRYRDAHTKAFGRLHEVQRTGSDKLSVRVVRLSVIKVPPLLYH